MEKRHIFWLDNERYTYYLYHKNFNFAMIENISEYRESGYYNLSCAFDIETSKINEHFTSMYVWQFAIDKETFIGRTWDEFKLFMKELSNYLNTKESGLKLRVWVQNLSYEMSFMRKHLKYKYDKKRKQYSVFAIDKRKYIYCITKDNIEFRDSLMLTCRPLSQYKKTYGLKIGKLEGEIDYKLLRNSNTVLTEKDLAYSINDVQTLTEWDRVYIVNEFLRKDLKIPLTSTGIVRDELKRNFKKIQKDERDKLKDMLRRAYPNESDYQNMIRWVYRGGFVHANALYSDEIIRGSFMDSYDKKSSYPASLLQNKFPMKFIHKKKCIFENDIYPNYNYKKWKNFAFIITVKISNITSKSYHHIESKNKLFSFKNAKFDNGRLIQADEIIVCLTDVDYLNYIDFYEWKEIKCLNIMIADKEYLPKYVLDLTLKYYYLKSTLDKDSVDYTLCKYKLNSIYGMMVTSLYNQNYLMSEDCDLYLSDKIKDYNVLTKNQILLPQWGVYCSAYSRREELLIHKHCSEYAMYGDTDSCKISNVLACAEWINQHNEMLRRINKRMYVGDWDRNIFKEIGTFCSEGKIFKFKTLGAKRYLYSTSDFDKKEYKYMLKKHPVIAGCTKKAFADFSKDKKDIFEEFKDTMKIEESYKLSSVYSDEVQDDFVVDYNGVKCLQTEKSCVTLNDVQFTLKLDVNYKEYLQFIEQHRNERSIVERI